MTEKPEPLVEYIHSYKSELLDRVNTDTEKFNDLANQTELRFSIQLLTLASAIFTVIGGFIVGQSRIENDGIKVMVMIVVTSLLISIIAGLTNLRVITHFWKNAASYIHQKGPLIIDDSSQTINDLKKLRAQLTNHNNTMVRNSDNGAQITQAVSFGLGVCFLFILLVIKIFS